MQTKILTSAFYFFTIVIFNFQSQAQTWGFGKNVSTEAFDTRGIAMTKGVNGSFFNGGTFSDTVKIGTQLHIVDTKLGFYITKQDLTGNLIWSISDKGVNPGFNASAMYSTLGALAADTSGNVLAFGNFGLYENSMNKLFLNKYNSLGVKQWSAWVDMAVSTTSVPVAVCADDSGNVYITGHTFNTLTFYDGDGYTTHPNNTLVTSGAGTEFLAKYSATGVFQWIKEYTNPYSTRATSLTATNDGILLCGKTGGGGVVDFGNSVTAAITNLKKGAFITKYNFNGLAQWVLKAEGTDTPFIAITLDNNYDIIMCGRLNDGSIGTFTTISAAYVGFVGKVNSGGTAQWVSFETAFQYNAPMGVALSNNSILVVGNTLVTKPQGGNGYAIAAQRYNNMGNLLAYDTASTDTYSNISASSLITTSTGDIWISGAYRGELITGNINLNSPSLLESNIFLAKINATGGIIASLNNFDNQIANIVLFPNPTSGHFVIQSQDSKYKIEICNVLGENIYSSSIEKKTATEINLSIFPKGIYFVNFYEREKRYSKKIVVE